MHGLSWSRALSICASLLAASSLPISAARAQIAGENVNMVSGTEWPGGDPFLQRQNEPTMAVSSANPQHLMAGANDYRSVDVPVPASHFAKMKATPDAWLGVFKSLDGGQTWKSTLLPGYLGDASAEGAASPLRAKLSAPGATPGTTEALELPACADPVMRAGTDGMFYYAGINFSRDKRANRLFIARFIDLNDRENGDASRAVPTDPIRYVDTVVISANLPARPNAFIDKPWIAVDVPRAGSATCTVTTKRADGTPVTRSFPGGTVYAAWAEFEQPDEKRSDIMFSWSANCGQSWVPPYKISSNNSVLSQGVSLAIEPVTGRVYASWRRAATSLAPRQADAIMGTRSEGRKRHFSHARVVANLAASPFDQGTSYGSFRSNVFPSLAISSDGASSWAHIAWTDRQASGDARVVLSTARVHPRPVGDDDDDEPEDNDDETRLSWSRPVAVDAQPSTDDANHAFGRGHQFMPSLTAGQGRLVLTYYDSRFDHTRRYFRPRAPVNGEFPGGKFYDEELAPIGDYDQQMALGAPAGGAVAGPVFNPWLADSFGNVDPATGKPTPTSLSNWVKVRHTVEVRAAMADAGPSPLFRSIAVSRYPFGASGEGSPAAGEPLTVPRFDSATAPSPPAATRQPGEVLTVVDGQGGLQLLSQFQMNAPNFPIFRNGSVAFIGDYIDVAGPGFVVQNGGWAFNTARSATPVFHAVWTSNQDVRTPPIDAATGLPAWDQYVPPGTGGALSKYLGDGQTRTQACNPRFPAFAGSRDQNIYTARITDGLAVATPQNVKPLAGPDATGRLTPVPRSFVIAATNSSARAMTVAFSAALPAGQSGVELSWVAGATGGAAVPSASGIVVPAFSSVSKTLFARLTTATNPGATILARVEQTSGCTAATCASATLTLNPPVALASLLQPEGVPTNVQNVGSAEQLQGVVFDRFLSDPNWSNPNWSNSNPNPNWSNPNWSNPNWSNLGYTGPNWSNPNWSNLGFTNPNWSNPNWSNPNWSNPNWSNPNWSNPNWSNPNWSNPNWSNTAISDLNASVANSGNTTTAYSVKLVRDAGKPFTYAGPIQLLITKVYETPTLDGCFVRPRPNFQLAVNVPSMPVVPSSAFVDPALDAASGFATVTLAPGERALLTIRAQLSIAQMAELGKAISPAVIPQNFPAATVTYDQVRGSATSPVALPGSLATSTALDPIGPTAGAAFRATVTPAAATGSVTFVRTAGATSRTAALVALAGGVADAAIDPPLGAGETLVAYYGGDATFDPSTSAPRAAGTRRLVVFAGVNVRTGSPTTARVTVFNDGPLGEPVATAAVTVNGTALAYQGAGAYSGPIATLTAGARYAVAVADGATQVAAAGRVPSEPTVTAPSGGTTFLRSAPIPVAWSSATAPDFYVLDVGAGAYLLEQIPGAQTSATVPAGALPAGNHAVHLGAVASGSVSGDAAPLSGAQATHQGPTDPIVTVAAASLGIAGAINDGFVQIRVNQNFAPLGGATVSITLPGLTVDLPETAAGSGIYQTTTFAMPVPGTTVALWVRGGGVQAQASAVVPATPTLTAPAAGSTVPVASPLTVTWTSPSDPSGFALDGFCGAAFVQCRPGSWATVPGTDRSTVLAASFFPAGPVHMALYAFNQMAWTGDALPGSTVHLQAQTPTSGTWHDFTAQAVSVATVTTSGAVPSITGAGYPVALIGVVQAIVPEPALRPTGTVTFVDGVGGPAVGTAPLGDCGSLGALPPTSCQLNPAPGCTALACATVVASGLSPGTGLALNHHVFASYTGDASFRASQQTVDNQVTIVQTNAWVASGVTAAVGVGYGSSVAALGGRLYKFGGIDPATSTASGQFELFDASTNAWTTQAPMPQATGMAAVATSGGRIYLLGGVGTESQVNIYDPATGSWASGAALPFGRRGAAAVADPAGRIYLLGGALDPALGGGRMARVDLYDPATNSWASTPPAAMSVPRHSLGAAWLNGRIVTAGGDDGLTTNFIGSRAVESYDPATNTWEPLPSLLALRAGMGLAAAGGKLYAVGGYSQNTSPVAVFPPSYPAPVEVYDPATGGWTVGPSLQIPRSYAGVALSEWNGGIYIVGGFNGVQPRQTEMLFPAP